MSSCDPNCRRVWTCGKEDLHSRTGEENDCLKKVMGDPARVPKDTNPYAEEGEASGTTGKNGVGKLIPPKTSLWAILFIVGRTCVWGCTVLPSEAGIGPYFETIGWENTHTNGLTTGTIKVETICKPDETAVPVGAEKHTDIFAKCHLLGTIAWPGPVTVVYSELETSAADEAPVAGDVEP